ncbi:MAG: hypothetical protein AAF799_16050 [Myxococcota bacterium]
MTLAPPRPKVAYFTAGTVGAGHMVRGEAIYRGLQRAGFAGEYRVFAPPTDFDGIGRAPRTSVAVKADPLLADPSRVRDSALGRALRTWAPDLLIVDMFWAPVRHLLAALGCPAWLLVRACPPIWLQGRGDVRFDPGAWERIIEIEPLQLPEATHRIDPIVIVDPDECASAEDSFAALGVEPGRDFTVVCHAGKPGELEVLRQTAERVRSPGSTLVSLDLRRQGLFPAAAWLGAASGIVMGAGYNGFWETQWLGRDARAHFVPFERSLDRQSLRVDVFRGRRPAENGANALARAILGR